MTQTFPQKIVSLFVSAILLCPAGGIALAESPAGSDSLLESARYIQRAEEELNCSTAEANRWAGIAASTLGQYRVVSDSERDTASMLRVRIAFLRHDIDVRQKALKEAAGDIAKRMAARQLNSAQRLIQGVRTNTPTCDSRFRQWEFETSQGLGQADRLVQSADEQFGRDPKQALHLYQSALAINVEQPGIGARIESARAASRNGHPVLKKVVWITVGIALAGAAAYEGERYYQQHQQQRLSRSSANSKPVVSVPSPK